MLCIIVILMVIQKVGIKSLSSMVSFSKCYVLSGTSNKRINGWDNSYHSLGLSIKWLLKIEMQQRIGIFIGWELSWLLKRIVEVLTPWTVASTLTYTRLSSISLYFQTLLNRCLEVVWHPSGFNSRNKMHSTYLEHLPYQQLNHSFA